MMEKTFTLVVSHLHSKDFVLEGLFQPALRAYIVVGLKSKSILKPAMFK